MRGAGRGTEPRGVPERPAGAARPRGGPGALGRLSPPPPPTPQPRDSREAARRPGRPRPGPPPPSACTRKLPPDARPTRASASCPPRRADVSRPGGAGPRRGGAAWGRGGGGLSRHGGAEPRPQVIRTAPPEGVRAAERGTAEE